MTALQVWLANAASSTLSTANQLYASSGGSPATNATYSNFGTGTGFIEITSQGQVGTCVGSIGSPSGLGFLWDVTTLESQQFLSGNWSAIVRLNASQFVQATSTGLTQAGTLTADIYVRAFQRTSGGTYTQLVSMVLTGQTINNTFVSYSFPSTSASASATFPTGSKLYVDIWANITANANGNVNQGIRLNRLTTDTATFVGDTAATVVTPGYQAGATTFTTTITEQLTSFSAEATVNSFANLTTTITEQLASFKAEASANGSQAQTNQLTSFSAEATTTASFGSPTVPGVSVQVNNNSVMIREGSFEIDDSINAMSTCSFTIRDDSGTNHYQKGQQVSVTDHYYGLMFTGNLNSVEEQNVWPNAMIMSRADAQDNHYYPMKRTYIGDEYENQYAGAIATDLLNGLTAEGITAQYASRRETTQAQFALGTLSNVVAANNVGEGDLELLPVGTSVGVANTGVTNPSQMALKLTGYCASGYSGAFVYRKIWNGSVTVATGDALQCTIWISSDSPEIKASVDMIFSDGSKFSASADAGHDGQGFTPAPSNDLSGFANDQWYDRNFGVGGVLIGKTITGIAICLGGSNQGNYTAYFRSIKYVNGSTVKINAFTGTMTAPSVNTQIANNGYTNVIVQAVTTYDKYDAFYYTFSLDPVKVVRNSVATWTTKNLDNGGVVNIYSSIDGVGGDKHTSGQGFINLLPGMLTTGMLVYIIAEQIVGKYPDLCPQLDKLNVEINPSFSNSVVNVVKTWYSNADFTAGGTLNNLVVSPDNVGILLAGKTIPYDSTNDYAGVTTWFGSNPVPTLQKRQLNIANDGHGDARIRLDNIGSWQNFIAEVDVQVPNDPGQNVGLTYRTTGWQNNNDTYAYNAFINQTQVAFAKGTNSSSGAGSFTTVGTPVTVALQGGSWHRLKVIVSGTSHSIYLDDALIIQRTDSSYTASGQLALRYFNNSGTAGSANFDNFGITNSLSGTWVSNPISLTSLQAAGYGNSFIRWDTLNTPETTSILVETSLNGGSSYQTCTNGGPIPNIATSGLNTLIVRLTLSANNASAFPYTVGLTVGIVGAFNATGTRISTALSLLNVGRLGNSLVAWNALLPPGCTLGVDTSINGGGTWTDVSSQNGGSIPGLTVQPDPWLDTFDSNTVANYSNVNGSGSLYAIRAFAGPVPLNGSWAYDIAHSRLNVTATALSLLVYGAATATDLDVQMHTDYSDAAGLVWRYTSTSSYYDLVVQDGSSTGGSANTAAVFKVSSGTRTQLATASINFTRGTFKLFKVTMLAGVISVYMDGDQVLTYTDGSPLSNGKCGLRSGIGSAHIYQLRIQPLGQDVTAISVQTRFRLASTNPAYTPQVLDATLAAYGNTISKGALIPATQYGFKYLSDCFDDLVKQSAAATGNQWWWYIDKYKKFYMLPQTGLPAPWIASDNPGDFLTGVKVTNLSDLYRNRQIIKNVIATAAIDDSRVGDGFTQNWTLDYALADVPTITVNGVAATVGVKGTDTGRDFYYAIGDPVIAQDSSGAILVSTQTIRFVGTGQYTTYSQYDDLVEQANFKLIEGGSGIVENVEDGNGISKDAGDQLAKARVKQYGIRGKQLEATTRRYGLTPGMLLSVTLPQYGLLDVPFLIRNIRTTLTTEYDTAQAAMVQHAWMSITAVSGADLSDWVKLFQRDQ
jgi:hypothetical protein